MKLLKRKFIKIIGLSIVSTFFPLKYLLAATKKIINPNLSNKQKNIMFNEGTERPFTSDLLNEKRQGFYHCANCGNKLFSSTSKFDSGTGWPSFTQPATIEAIGYVSDTSHGMERIEVVCNVCDSHLGHIFPDGPLPTGLRYCVNAASMKKL